MTVFHERNQEGELWRFGCADYIQSRAMLQVKLRSARISIEYCEHGVSTVIQRSEF